MLKKLSIKNYALIHELTIEFGEGLNIITGETGAGKSILIGALGLLLGDRAQKDVIRQGENQSVVEGFFCPTSTDWLKSYSNQFELFDSELIMRREVYENGRSRCFVNDSPVSLSVFVDKYPTTMIGRFARLIIAAAISGFTMTLAFVGPAISAVCQDSAFALIFINLFS